MLNNRTTFMERLNDRVAAIEALLQKLEPVEGLLERLTLLEENIYTTKNMFTFMEACAYLGVSESLYAEYKDLNDLLLERKRQTI